MLKMTKLGMLCEILSSAALQLSCGQQYEDFSNLSEFRKSDWYKHFEGMQHLCEGWGLSLEPVLSIDVDKRPFYIGVVMCDRSPAPAFAPMGHYCFISTKRCEFALSEFRKYCKSQGVNTDCVSKEIRKIYHCK